ncbi:MAG TPA: nucleotide-binding protein [Myxococcales bacterium]|jgi:hypothetical protein
MRKVSMLAMSAALALLAGCNAKKAEEAKAGAPATGTAMGAKPALPPTKNAAAGLGDGGLKGKVLEKIDAASYSYLRLQTAQGEVWAAVPQTGTQVGMDVEVIGGMDMNGFESKTLGRKFDKIVFGQLGGGPGPGATPEQIAKVAAATGTPPSNLMAAGALPPGHPPMGGAANVGDVKVEKVEKAAGANAKTVAEVWAQKATLKQAKVVVRGKVVKLNSGIMGKTWLHLRDGSGTDEAKDNDLTVTTKETAAAVGDVVTVEGAVQVDKDFGAGYQYPVIVEDASVKK